MPGRFPVDLACIDCLLDFPGGGQTAPFAEKFAAGQKKESLGSAKRKGPARDAATRGSAEAAA
jgi:hypothetical protein